VEGNGRPVVLSVSQKISLKSMQFVFVIFSWNKKCSDVDGGSGMNMRCGQQGSQTLQTPPQ
jgi:hypothetical protein